MLDVLMPNAWTFSSEPYSLEPPLKRRRVVYHIILVTSLVPDLTNRTTISHLPNEILETIFGYVDPYTVRTTIRCVSKHWDDIALTPIFWEDFKFPRSFRVDTENYVKLLSLPRFSRLKSLVFGWNNKVSDVVLDRLLQANPSLYSSAETLEIQRCHGLGDQTMKKISKFTNLRHFRLHNSSNWKGITDAGMAEIAKLVHLESLQLNYWKRITNSSAVFISKLTELRELHISGSSLINDEGIFHLSSLRNLTSLTLSLCGTLTDKALQCIARNNTQLQYLSLGYNNPLSCFSDEGLKELLKLKLLRELRLERSWGLLNGNGVKLIKEHIPCLVVRQW